MLRETRARCLSEQQGIGGIFILAECFLTDFKRISVKMMSVSSKILLMGRIYEYLFGETKFSYEKILIFFFTINYTIFAPLNV